MNNDHFLSLALQTLLDNTSDMLFFKDTNLIYRGGSEPFADMVGAKNIKSIIGKTDFEILPPELALEYTEDDKRILKSGISLVDKIEPLTDLDGKKRYSSTSKFLIRDENQNIIGLCGLARDVTAQITLMEELEQREMANQMFDDVFEADITENRILRAEGTGLAAIMGNEITQTYSETISAICEKYIHNDFSRELCDLHSSSHLFSEYANGTKRFTRTVLQTLDGENYRWVTITSRLYFSTVSGTLRIIMFFTDVDDDHRSRELLRKTAQTDSLTGLLNRRNTIERITDCITGYGREGTHALLFIDLDMFKQINDNLGHTVGDNVLVTTAKSLKKLFGKENIVGRIGGDEFLVLLKNVDNIEAAKEIADNIFKSFDKVNFGDNVKVTCSVGIALCSKGDKSFDDLYSQADKAMYDAKQLGRNKITVFE